jgi:acyl-CoA dehydrogenase
MNLDFSEDHYVLRDQLRRFLADQCPPSVVRAVAAGAQSHDRGLYRKLAELGMLGAAIPEEYGGAGVGQLELCILAQELGRALAPVPACSTIYLGANFLLLAGDEYQKRRLLPAFATGEKVCAVALAEGPGQVTQATVNAVARNGMISGTKIPVPDGDGADVAIVLARDGNAGMRDAHSLFLVDLSAPGVIRERVETIDITRGSARLSFENAPAEPLGATGEAWQLIERVFDRAAVLIAFEQVGGAERVIELSQDFALDRMAFGRPIGSFQALKHMMANMYVEATLARSNAYYGAWALSMQADELPAAAATAFLSGSRAFMECAKSNIQVHGGMGFTWESDCHLFYRRASALRLTLGPPSWWQDRLIGKMRERATVAEDAS